jgi:hypothetical protein
VFCRRRVLQAACSAGGVFYRRRVLQAACPAGATGATHRVAEFEQNSQVPDSALQNIDVRCGPPLY